MEVRKFIKKTLQILVIVTSLLFLLAVPASLVCVAIGSKVGTIVMLSLTLLSLVFISVASLEGERSEPSESSSETNRRCEEVYNEDRVNDRRGKQKLKDS